MSDVRNNISFVRLIYSITLAVCLAPFVSHAQEISHVDFEVNGSTVKITYDVTNCSGNEDYDMKLSVAQNGELTEIKSGLSGDIEHVACGSSNLIVWDVLADRAELKGSIFFVVDILRTHPIVTEDSPIAYDPDDGRPAGAVPYGDQAIDYAPPRQRAYGPPLGFFQLAAPWLAFAQAIILSNSGPRAVMHRRSRATFSQPMRHP